MSMHLRSRWSSLAAASLVLMACLSVAQAQTLTSITVAQVYDPSTSINLGVYADRQFTATGNYSDGTQQYLTQKVTWSSANTGIATVTPTMGLVTAVAPGTVNIMATLSGVTGSTSLTVVAANLTALAVTPSTSWTMQSGTQLQYHLTAEYGDGVMQDATSAATWTSSVTSVATVTASGVVSAIGAGTTVITGAYGPGKNTSTLTVTTTAPQNLGSWTQPQYLGMTPIHAALMNTGKVLLWGYPDGRVGGPAPGRVYDPVANTLIDVTVPWPIDIFCSGLSFLPNGTLLVDGGTDDAQSPSDSGITNTSFFDPSTNQWSQGASMTYSRWYPTTVVLPNGDVLAASGTDNDGVTIQQALETYNPNTSSWTVLPTSANIPHPIDLYPLLLTLGNGNVFYAAPRQNSIELNLKTNTWTSIANMNFGTRYHAAALLFPGSGSQVMVVGGAASDNNGGANPTNTTETINLSATTPAWTYGAPLNIARYNHNLLYLADGSAMVVGGNQSSHYITPIQQPELYSFVTNKWTLLPPQNAQRGYHSTAILLPDGRVISAGSDAGTPFDATYEIYSPPYLSNGPRPTITSAPSTITYGKQFTISTPQATVIKKVALLRAGTTTHAVHMDDYRYVTMKFTAAKGVLTVTPPATANLAPPGYYMLVILNAKGVPSIMPFVDVQ